MLNAWFIAFFWPIKDMIFLYYTNSWFFAVFSEIYDEILRTNFLRKTANHLSENTIITDSMCLGNFKNWFRVGSKISHLIAEVLKSEKNNLYKFASFW